MTPMYGKGKRYNQTRVRARAYRRTKGWKNAHSSKGELNSHKVNYYKLVNRRGYTLEDIL